MDFILFSARNRSSTRARISRSRLSIYAGVLTGVFLGLHLIGCAHGPNKQNTVAGIVNSPEELIANTRQFVFEGRRSGEGYFSPDGELMIFQSERADDNPFYQMYVRDLKKNATIRVSPGYGKTTCGWVAPDKRSVIFSSTHQDPKSREHQRKELEFRASGEQRRYSWDYDPEYDIYRAPIQAGPTQYANLTHTKGYDAEGSISPDGRLIVFASNRQAYDHKLTPEEAIQLARDPSYFMDLYIMGADGKNVRRLTKSPGYDGGPFFSPDGERIVWRRFTPDGMTAEIYSMRRDGSDEKKLTSLGAMSWAPFYHPSGDYIIFTSSVFGHQNFELFIVDTEGREKPVRVTNWEGFDGLPVFTPDGQKLTWNRKISSSESQIMIADWSDARARAALHLKPAAPKASLMKSEISILDLKTDLKYLASKELRGRATGSSEEKQYSQVISKYFQDIGLAPYNGHDYAQVFPFTKNATLGEKNRLEQAPSNGSSTPSVATAQNLELDKNWRPLAFSKVGAIPASALVFAGYGIRAPRDPNQAEYDSYAGLDVKNKWVIVFRYVPEKISSDRALYLQRYAKLEHKAILARDLGARGVIFVSGPNAGAKNPLIPFHGTATDVGITAISLSDDVAARYLETHGRKLTEIQNDLDQEKVVKGFEIDGVQLAANIDIRSTASQGQNTLGLLRVPGATRTLIIGAHGDHLGDSPQEDSLRTAKDTDPIHYGADDNASGVSAVLELAHHLKNQPTSRLKQNILFAVWSGEELGTLGSTYFARQIQSLGLKPSAYINMDMIGRWKLDPKTKSLEPLTVQGLGSSPKWRELIEGLGLDFALNLQNDPYLPTDAMALYIAKVPVINFFTGVHSDYHTPRDTEDKINYQGLEKVTQTVARLAQAIVTTPSALPYAEVARSSTGDQRRGFRIYLGTIPDYTQSDVPGVKLSGVVAKGPAEKAGLRGGDVIVEFSSKKIANIYDYVFILETLKPGEKTKIVVLREGQRREVDITPMAKE